MKKLKHLALILLVFTVIVCSLGGVNCSAASSEIYFNSHTLNIGDTFTVTVKIDGGESMYATEAFIQYDASLLDYVGGDSCNLVDGQVKIVGTPGGSSESRYTIRFTAKASGSSNVKLHSVSYVGADTQTVTGKTGTVTIKAPAASEPPVSSETSTPAASDNANLKRLSVEGATLSPAFSRNTTGYSATVANTVTSVKVKAVASDSGAKVEGAGTYPLSEGNNKISITVLAADGTTKKEYAISIKRNTAAEDAAVPVEPTVENPYSVTVDDANYTILNDITALAVPSGFTASVTTFNGVEIPTLVEPSQTVTLCWLIKEGADAPELFRYSEKDGFEKIAYTDIGGRFYIFEKLPADVSAPTSFYETVLPLETGKVEAYAYNSSKLADIYIVYCWREGEYGYYRYDQRDNTIQRAPEFTPVTEVIAEPEDEKNTFVQWYLSLTNVAKAIIYIAIFGVFALIALTVLVIVLIRKYPRRPRIPMIIDELPTNEEIDGFSFDEK